MLEEPSNIIKIPKTNILCDVRLSIQKFETKFGIKRTILSRIRIQKFCVEENSKKLFAMKPKKNGLNISNNFLI